MSKIISVNFDDIFSFYANLEEEDNYFYTCNLFEVSDEEYTELLRLQAEYKKYQDMLEEIKKRQELEWDFDNQVFKPADW